MRKIIFLDFDGVMDTAFYDQYLVSNNLPETDKYGVVFDPECIKSLGRIVDETDADIVVSSTWKDFMSMEEIHEMWKDRNLPGEVIDVTPTVSRHRGDEIDAWLKEYGKPCSYVIFDDMPFSEFNAHHREYFLLVNAYYGLDDVLAERAINILNRDYYDEVEKESNRVLIIPDVHGRSFWRKAEDLVYDYDHIIFLGDYLDPYEFEFIPIERAIEYLLDIIRLKQNYPEKVILLLGNHDLHYWWDNDMDCSRRDVLNIGIVHRILMMHRDCFQLACTLSSSTKEYLFTHAGVLTGWVSDNKNQLSAVFPENIFDVKCAGIVKWLNSLLNAPGFGLLRQVSSYRGGYDEYGSPIWADVREHKSASTQFPFYQIFGHTLQDEPTITEQWACLDCMRMFALSLDDDVITEV